MKKLFWKSTSFLSIPENLRSVQVLEKQEAFFRNRYRKSIWLYKEMSETIKKGEGCGIIKNKNKLIKAHHQI